MANTLTRGQEVVGDADRIARELGFEFDVFVKVVRRGHGDTLVQFHVFLHKDFPMRKLLYEQSQIFAFLHLIHDTFTDLVDGLTVAHVRHGHCGKMDVLSVAEVLD